MKRVMVVDDEVMLAQTIGEILQDEGYEVLLAYGSKRMLILLETEHPDLILLDVMMPDGDGRDAAAAIQSNPRLRDIPLLMMSAAVSPLMMNVPIAGFIRKPFDLDELLTQVKDTIGLAEGN